MLLGQSLEKLIASKSPRKSEYSTRDIKIILEYFGLGEEKFPTLELLGNKYGITKQYISKDIIETKFKRKIKIEELPILITIHEVLKNELDQQGYVFYSSLLSLLTDVGLIDNLFHLKGLLNLLECFNIGEDVDIFTTSISRATKMDLLRDEEFLIIRKEFQQPLKKEIQNILKFPGRIIGICCLDDVYNKNQQLLLPLSATKRILQNTKNVWSKEIDHKFWFLVEDRENPIITNLGKIKNIGSTFSKKILISVIDNALHAHALPSNSLKLIRPNQIVIEHYLDNSKYISQQNGYYQFQEELNSYELSDTENDIFEYFQKIKSDTSQNIISFLEQKNSLRSDSKGHDILIKNCFNSPLLYKSPVTTPKKRGERYSFVFIKEYIGDLVPPLESDYQFFRNKLLNLYGQTDTDREIKTRNEQSILRNWLFKNKKTEKCALCGKEYSIDSLVAAHKKPRSKCSDNERTDPYIVMPACKFGCDYVYEKRWITISNGTIDKNLVSTPNISISEKQYIDSINGRKLDEIWLQGYDAYFNFDE